MRILSVIKANDRDRNPFILINIPPERPFDPGFVLPLTFDQANQLHHAVRMAVEARFLEVDFEYRIGLK